MSSMAAVRTKENPNRNPGSHPSNKSFDAIFVEPPLTVVTTEDLLSPATLVDTYAYNLPNLRQPFGCRNPTQFAHDHSRLQGYLQELFRSQQETVILGDPVIVQ